MKARATRQGRRELFLDFGPAWSERMEIALCLAKDDFSYVTYRLLPSFLFLHETRGGMTMKREQSMRDV
jgi:hypothetical protein